MNPDPNRRRVLLADFIPVQRDGVELAANFGLILEVTPRG